MIPVRVPADAPLHIVSVKQIPPDHPLHGEPCPACGYPLGGAAALVYVGCDPASRKSAGWMTGAAVAVHPPCAGADENDEASDG